ncbi:MAG TPA: O-methyltransferase [Candidatus Binatia bacterium]|nr:O-methyltransferase [Candidatus Binatia bacterium]
MPTETPTQSAWSAVDTYLSGVLLPDDPALEEAVRSSERAGLPAIQVSPLQGKMLHLLALMRGARSILEIGTLGGYSTIWMAKALRPGGRLITLEIDPKHAEVARANLLRAGLERLVDVRVGRALDTLPRLVEEGAGPFDLVFIDADKPSGTDYFQWSLKLSRVGTIIVVDNVVRDGEVADASSTDASVVGSRRVLEAMAAEPRVSATAIQTVGVKGYDGFAMALVIQ